MKNFKQYFIKEIDSEIKTKEAEVVKSNEEIKILEARIKVEKKMSTMKDIPKEIIEGTKYSIEALEGILTMEENKNIEFKKDLKILDYRKQVINKFENDEL